MSHDLATTRLVGNRSFKRGANRAILLALTSAAWMACPQAAFAASGTWTLDGNDSWDAITPNNTPWSNGAGPVAEGSGNTANFGTIDITATRTATLANPLMIGNLIFGDTTTSTSAFGWVVSNGGIASNTLTLAGTTPAITVNALGGTGSSGDSPFGTATVSAVIKGTQGLVKDGTGNVGTSILVLSGANEYSGGTTINTGSIRVKNSSALGAGAVTVASGARLQLSGGVTVANTININGANALYSHSGSGTPDLSGVVNLQSNSGISLNNGNGNAAMTLSGTLNLNGNILTATTINISPAITISGVINGSGGITKTNDGELRISNDNSASYSGTTKLQRGVLALASNGALGSGTFDYAADNDQAATIRSTNTTARAIGTAVTFSGGNANSKYNFGSTSASANGDLTFTNTNDISLGAVTRNLRVHNRTQFDAGLTGTSGILMNTGTGTLVLAGNNTYTGNTTVSAGTLELADNAGMKFLIGATGVNNSITGTGTVNLDGDFTFDLTSAGTTVGDSWNIVDVTNLTESFGDTFTVVGFADAGSNLWTKSIDATKGYQFSESSGVLSVVLIPEPAMLALVFGVAGLSLMARRRRVS